MLHKEKISEFSCNCNQRKILCNFDMNGCVCSKVRAADKITSSSPNMLYMIAAGVFIDESPSGKPKTARRCCSYWEV